MVSHPCDISMLLVWHLPGQTKDMTGIALVSVHCQCSIQIEMGRKFCWYFPYMQVIAITYNWLHVTFEKYLFHYNETSFILRAVDLHSLSLSLQSGKMQTTKQGHRLPVIKVSLANLSRFCLNSLTMQISSPKHEIIHDRHQMNHIFSGKTHLPFK